MLDFGFYNMDCMEGMKQFPDKYFDLAIVDPPYGSGLGESDRGGGIGSENDSTDTRRIPRGGVAWERQVPVSRTGGTWAAKFSKKS